MTIVKLSLIGATIFALTLTTHANDGNTLTKKTELVQKNYPYLGAKLGTLRVADIEKNATTYGVYGGYQFKSGYGIEMDYNTAETFKTHVDGIEVDAKAQTYGAYFTYSQNLEIIPVYLKFKLGMNKVQADVSLSEDVYNDFERKRVGHSAFAYGVGVGYTLNKNFDLDAEYHSLNDGDKILALGAKVKF